MRAALLFALVRPGCVLVARAVLLSSAGVAVHGGGAASLRHARSAGPHFRGSKWARRRGVTKAPAPSRALSSCLP
jgi:hypothetical protein